MAKKKKIENEASTLAVVKGFIANKKAKIIDPFAAARGKKSEKPWYLKDLNETIEMVEDYLSDHMRVIKEEEDSDESDKKEEEPKKNKGFSHYSKPGEESRKNISKEKKQPDKHAGNPPETYSQSKTKEVSQPKPEESGMSPEETQAIEAFLQQNFPGYEKTDDLIARLKSGKFKTSPEKGSNVEPITKSLRLIRDRMVKYGQNPELAKRNPEDVKRISQFLNKVYQMGGGQPSAGYKAYIDSQRKAFSNLQFSNLPRELKQKVVADADAAREGGDISGKGTLTIGPDRRVIKMGFLSPETLDSIKTWYKSNAQKIPLGVRGQKDIRKSERFSPNQKVKSRLGQRQTAAPEPGIPGEIKDMDTLHKKYSSQHPMDPETGLNRDEEGPLFPASGHAKGRFQGSVGGALKNAFEKLFSGYLDSDIEIANPKINRFVDTEDEVSTPEGSGIDPNTTKKMTVHQKILHNLSDKYDINAFEVLEKYMNAIAQKNQVPSVEDLGKLEDQKIDLSDEELLRLFAKNPRVNIQDPKQQMGADTDYQKRAVSALLDLANLEDPSRFSAVGGKDAGDRGPEQFQRQLGHHLRKVMGKQGHDITKAAEHEGPVALTKNMAKVLARITPKKLPAEAIKYMERLRVADPQEYMAVRNKALQLLKRVSKDDFRTEMGEEFKKEFEKAQKSHLSAPEDIEGGSLASSEEKDHYRRMFHDLMSKHGTGEMDQQAFEDPSIQKGIRKLKRIQGIDTTPNELADLVKKFDDPDAVIGGREDAIARRVSREMKRKSDLLRKQTERKALASMLRNIYPQEQGDIKSLMARLQQNLAQHKDSMELSDLAKSSEFSSPAYLDAARHAATDIDKLGKKFAQYFLMNMQRAKEKEQAKQMGSTMKLPSIPKSHHVGSEEGFEQVSPEKFSTQSRPKALPKEKRQVPNPEIERLVQARKKERMARLGNVDEGFSLIEMMLGIDGSEEEISPEEMPWEEGEPENKKDFTPKLETLLRKTFKNG